MADGTNTLFGDFTRPVIVDLFCGIGGGSEGLRRATGRDPDVAVNHWSYAIQMHGKNHPETVHYQEDVFNIEPWKVCKGRRVKLLIGTAPCSHFSAAKGAAPKDEGIRCLSDVFIQWAEDIRPDVILLENVKEFVTWGPLGEDGKPIKARKGEDFKMWIQKFRDAGYVVEWRLLRACDYGAPTSRLRFFLIARCDGKPIVWPEPTHGGKGQPPHRTAAECIDWSIPMCSIFADKKEAKAWAKKHKTGIPVRPLAEKTLRRIAAGVDKFVLNNADPFLLCLSHGGRLEPLNTPLRTTTTTKGGERALIAPVLSRQFGASVGQGVDSPMPTATAGVNKSALVAAELIKFYGTSTGAPLDGTFPTVTSGGQHVGLVAAFMQKYYGSEGQNQPVSRPLDTATTKARFGLVTVEIDGETWAIVDIKMRMLKARELARAQGFPDSYILEGTEAQQIKGIGNSVVPQVIEAIVRALGLL